MLAAHPSPSERPGGALPAVHAARQPADRRVAGRPARARAVSRPDRRHRRPAHVCGGACVPARRTACPSARRHPHAPRARAARSSRSSARGSLRRGDFGWDVSVLQFLLTRRGVYSGALDGYMGKETDGGAAPLPAQMHLQVDAIVGPRTLTAIVRRDSRAGARPSRRRASRQSIYIVQLGRLADGDRADARHVDRGARAREPASTPSRPIMIGQKLRAAGSRRRGALASRRVDVRAMLDAWSARLGVDPHLVRALAWMESGLPDAIVSPAGARRRAADAADHAPVRRDGARRAADPAHRRRRRRGGRPLPQASALRSSTATSASRSRAGTRASAPCGSTGRTR